MKTQLTFLTVIFSLLLSSTSTFANGKKKESRVSKVIAVDLTERLENIAELNANIRSLNLQLKTLDIALEDAKKQSNRKGTYIVTKRVADAVSAITTLAGVLAATKYQNHAKILKITSSIFGIAQGVSVLASLAADLAPGEVGNIQQKIHEAKIVLVATEKNLDLEVEMLCQGEPSNQMCK